MLNVIVLIDVMLNVMAPFNELPVPLYFGATPN